MLPDLTLTQWAAVGGLLAGVGGMLTALITLLVVVLGRKRVQFWAHDPHARWSMPDRYGNGGGEPWVTFKLSNVGDGTALRVEPDKYVKLYVTNAGHGARFRSAPILRSGETIHLGVEVPIAEWEKASFRLRWRAAPMWPLFSRRGQTLRFAQFVERPKVVISTHDEDGNVFEQQFATMAEAESAAEGRRVL